MKVQEMLDRFYNPVMHGATYISLPCMAATAEAAARLAGRELVKRALYALYYAPEKMFSCPLELRRWRSNFKYGAPCEYWDFKAELYVTFDRYNTLCRSKFILPDVLEVLPNGRHVISKAKLLEADREYHFLTDLHSPTEGDVELLAQEIIKEVA